MLDHHACKETFLPIKLLDSCSTMYHLTNADCATRHISSFDRNVIARQAECH